jgi:hypothetical protein
MHPVRSDTIWKLITIKEHQLISVMVFMLRGKRGLGEVYLQETKTRDLIDAAYTHAQVR